MSPRLVLWRAIIDREYFHDVCGSRYDESMKIRFAVTPPASALAEDSFPAYLESAEALGFDTIWLSDIPLGNLGDPVIALTFAAAATRRLKLGANIVPLGRNPLWLAKQLAQIDRLCGGRLLISLVPGLGSPAERAALGHSDDNRWQAIETIITMMRTWWAGEAVTARFGTFDFQGARIHPQPLQDPLELWLGGKTEAALKRVARISDGWLTSAMTPAETARACATIIRHCQTYERHVDTEHFGISMPYARRAPADADLEALRKRRSDGDLSEVVATGGEHMTDLVKAHIDGGISKFVVRPLDALSSAADWQGDLNWLADRLLPLQT